MKSFVKQVAAYLTGWCIVQPLYNRLIKYVRERELASPGPETRRYFALQAEAVADAMQDRLIPMESEADDFRRALRRIRSERLDRTDCRAIADAVLAAHGDSEGMGTTGSWVG